MRHTKNVTALVAAISVLSAIGGVSAAPPRVTPRMYYADVVSGRPFSKDPAVVKFNEKYWLYYSVPPYDRKPTAGWSIGVATSSNLVDWIKTGELRNTGKAEAKGFAAPGAIVLDGRVHLFYQTYGNGKRDAICHAWSDDGQDYLFYQGNDTDGKTWHLSVLPLDWKDGKPVLAPEKLPK
jgi:hypothetical protein